MDGEGDEARHTRHPGAPGGGSKKIPGKAHPRGKVAATTGAASDVPSPPSPDEYDGHDPHPADLDEEEEEVDESGRMAAAATAAGGGAAESSEAMEGRVHRSLPRVKTILENEAYLAGILTILEQTGCPNYPFASTSNGWTTAFHNVYATVALDCHHPVGKNRHHKFKDKMVEIWNAMEVEVLAGRKNPDLSPVFALGLKQLERYRNVTRDTEETRKIPRGGTVTAKIGASADDVGAEVPVPTAAVAAVQATPLPPGPKPKPDANGGATTAAGKPAPPVGAAVAGDAVAAAVPAAAAATVATVPSPARIPLPRRSRPRHLRNPPSSAKGPTSRESLVQIEGRLRRLEAVAFRSLSESGSGEGSKLFSHASAAHLGRLHHLWLQNRSFAAAASSSSSAAAADPDRARHAKRLKPHYEDAIRQYLSQLGTVVDGSDPDVLYASLLDLDALLRAQDFGGNDLPLAANGSKQPLDLGAQLRDAYKMTLDAYLKQINPDLAAEQEDEELSDAEESSGHRPSRKRPADEAMGGGNDTDDDHDEDGEEDGDEDEVDDVVNV